MTAPPDLEELYARAAEALKARDYDVAADLLRQVLVTDEDFKDASSLLAKAIRLKRRRWYTDSRYWGAIGAAVLLVVGILLAPYLSPATSRGGRAADAADWAPTRTPQPGTLQTAAPTLAPTAVPLAWRRVYIGQEWPRALVTTIVYDPVDPDVVYVGTRDAGIYKSIDGGLSWQPAHEGLGDAWVSSLVVDPRDAATLYAGVAQGGAYRTNDGGLHWSAINDGIDTFGWEWVSMVAVAAPDESRLYYSQSRNVYASSDQGATWKEVWPGAGHPKGPACPRHLVALAVDPNDVDNLLAVDLENPGEDMDCRTGIYRSQDGGVTWLLTQPMEPVLGLRSVTIAFDAEWRNVYAAGRDRPVYHSRDRGASWQEVLPAECLAFGVEPQTGVTAYCARLDKGWTRRDEGHGWPEIFGNAHIPFDAIAVSPYSSDSLLVGGQGLRATRDDGASWSAADNGLGALHLALALDPIQPERLMLEDQRCNVYLSSDGSRIWNPARDRTCRAETALSPSGDWLYWIDSGDRSLRVSKDGGATSSRLEWPVVPPEWDIIAAHPTTDSRILAVNGLEPPYVFISDDHGNSWHGATVVGGHEFLNPGPAPRIFFQPGNGERVYLVSMEEVFRSDDAGDSWRRCERTDSWNGSDSSKAGLIIDPASPDQLLLGTRRSGVMRSTDGCETWAASNEGLTSLFVNTLAVDPNNPDVIYAATDGGAYVSFDAGAHWNVINDGLLGATVVYSIVVDAASNVYAATPYGIFALESR